ncbi:tryptophan synthase subunit alpha [Buchnera aphidicola (Ceratoglyphina bambusae)]|uniref:tryptophan synthase subunit alpha n=1 Tax=Buchnera aphidicola TaxID=9 RepID=UPI0031B8524B
MNIIYKKLFSNLRKKKEGCLIPFIVLGDPDLDTSLEIIISIIENGADAIEIGIPFSDPLADGYIIQNANLRALKKNVTLLKCFDILKNLKNKYTNFPIGILTYANLIFNKGINNFYEICSKIGLDSILIVDVPIEESKMFYECSIKNNISQIFICPPNVNNVMLNKIIKMSKSYIYILSRSGVTGICKKKFFKTNLIVKKIKKISSIPLVQGFGIYSTNQIKNILMNKINGVICGSVVVKQIENNLDNKKVMIKKITNLIKKLKYSTKILL